MALVAVRCEIYAARANFFAFNLTEQRFKMKQRKFPPDLSTQELQYLLGDISRARLAQLEQAGVIKRTAHGRYATSSIPAFVKLQREAGAGPEALQDAKLDLLLQKVTMGKLDLEERQGKLVSIDEVREGWSAIVSMVRQRILALPSKLAPRLLGKHHAGEVESILRVGVYEALEDLSNPVTIKTNYGKIKGNGEGLEL
jgi:hypothetical protein